MDARAEVKTIRIASYKMRLVTRSINKKTIEEANAILFNTNKKAVASISKVLNSAVANATENHGMTIDNLYIKNIQVNEGPTLKRFRPRAKGRVDRILKRTSHIKVVVTDSPDWLEKGKK